MTPPILFQWLRQAGGRQNTAVPIALPSRGDLADENAFAHVLRLERRRAERSGTRLMLVVVSSEYFRGKRGRRAAGRAADAVSARIRETDVLGWYRQDAALGILLTQTGSFEALSIQAVMFKITQGLKNSLSLEEFKGIELSYHLYPQGEEASSHGQSPASSYPDLPSRRTANLSARIAKRTMDVSGSLLALLLLLPVFLVISLLVKFSSKGPVFFSQQRVGYRGRKFTFFKFRTMYVNNDPSIHRDYVTQLISGGATTQANGGLFKLARDPRITPVGRWLRKSSLDELPQFLNVLRGDMSLVGPRPPLPYEFDRYKPWHKRRVMELKPGLTGPWQIGGRSTTTFDEMVRMDLRYLKSKSFWNDCTILLKTPAAVLSGRGAC